MTLAKQMKKALVSRGYQARLVDLVEPESAGPFLYPGRPHHVLVEADGLLWDAAGAHPPEEVLAFWSGMLKTPLQLEPHHAKRARDQGLKDIPKLQPTAQLIVKDVVKSVEET